MRNLLGGEPFEGTQASFGARFLWDELHSKPFGPPLLLLSGHARPMEPELLFVHLSGILRVAKEQRVLKKGHLLQWKIKGGVLGKQLIWKHKSGVCHGVSLFE
jgi:hypothetical protein